MAKKHRPAMVPVNRNIHGPVRFPGVPCDLCGDPVTTMHGNPVVILEPKAGSPFWSAKHQRCARRRAEVQQRRNR